LADTGKSMMRGTTMKALDRLPMFLKALGLSLAVLMVTTALNGLVDLGGVLHDVACPDHGWLV
jgi:hypothetical protein